MDGRALVFTLLLSMLTSVIFGLAPAWAATRADVVPALKEESGTTFDPDLLPVFESVLESMGAGVRLAA